MLVERYWATTGAAAAPHRNWAAQRRAALPGKTRWAAPRRPPVPPRAGDRGRYAVHLLPLATTNKGP